MWRRVVIDRETSEVANENLKGLDPNWEGKEVIWQSIKCYIGINQEEVEDLFGTAVEAKPAAEDPAQIAEAGDASAPQREEPQIREYFDAANRDKVIPIIKHLASADRVLLAVENLDDAQVDIDKLNLLIK